MQYETLGRTALFAWLAVFGAVAAFATIVPSYRVEPEPGQGVAEPLAIPGLETPAAVPAASPFVRETRFQRSDTLGSLLGRLGVAEDEAQRLARLRSLRELRPGAYLTAELGADGSLLALSWLSGRDTLVRVAPEGGGYARSERDRKSTRLNSSH